MIIKTKQGSGGWRFYDNAREVSYSEFCRDNVPTLKVERERDATTCSTGFSFDNEGITEEIMICGERPYAIGDTILLVSFLDAEGPHNLYVDAETYLMNDAGRTIERIY